MAPISKAERQRQYRARRDADPVRRQRYLQREREKWQEDKLTGKKKGIKDMSERGKRCRRKRWREAQQRCRIKTEATCFIATPPESPDLEPQAGPSRLEMSK